MKHHQVIIVGAGLSGLYAALQLQRTGVDYIILEGRERTGGRVLSALETGDNPSTGIHVDMGATWIWPAINPDLIALVEELGLSVLLQGKAGDMLYERDRTRPPARYPTYQSSPEAVRIKGGMQALTGALKHLIPEDRILTGHNVVDMTNNAGQITVHARTSDGQGVHFQGGHVLLALPPALAARIQYVPALPEQLLSNWQNTQTWMAPHAKYVAVYQDDFLAEQRLSGDASSNAGPMVEVHDVSEPDTGKIALFGFIGVPASTRLTVSDSVMKDVCRAQMVRLFGAKAATPEAEYLKDWAADPFTATKGDLRNAVGHATAVPEPAEGVWRGKIAGIASEWSPEFTGYLAGAIDAALTGVQRFMAGH
jgi:monoamine oxidase